MIQFILAALIAIAPSPNKAPIVYQDIVTSHVQDKIERYVEEVHKADIGLKYLSGKGKMVDYIKSDKAEHTYMFYIQILLETVYKTEDIKYTGMQGMNMTIIVDDNIIIYSMITKPYWIHKKKTRLI